MSEEVTEAPKRGRKPGFTMTQEHRDKIQNSNILTCLIQHVTEGREMQPSQVTAGLGLLKKVLPDLQTTTIQGDEDGGAIQVNVTSDDAAL
jgi:hypothetical protein